MSSEFASDLFQVQITPVGSTMAFDLTGVETGRVVMYNSLDDCRDKNEKWQWAPSTRFVVNESGWKCFGLFLADREEVVWGSLVAIPFVDCVVGDLEIELETPENGEPDSAGPIVEEIIDEEIASMLETNLGSDDGVDVIWLPEVLVSDERRRLQNTVLTNSRFVFTTNGDANRMRNMVYSAVSGSSFVANLDSRLKASLGEYWGAKSARLLSNAAPTASPVKGMGFGATAPKITHQNGADATNIAATAIVVFGVCICGTLGYWFCRKSKRKTQEHVRLNAGPAKDYDACTGDMLTGDDYIV